MEVNAKSIVTLFCPPKRHAKTTVIVYGIGTFRVLVPIRDVMMGDEFGFG
jgi:hypothetical protein